MPNYIDTLEAVKQLQHVGYQGKTAGIVQYEDQKTLLLEAGVDEVFNYFAEVGVGLAEQSSHLAEQSSHLAEQSSHLAEGKHACVSK